MNFDYSPKVEQLRERLLAFFDQHIYPNEQRYHAEIEANRRAGNAWIPTKVIEELKPKARAAGLWNLFLPRSARAPEGLSNLEYAPLCEIMGRVYWAPEVFNCSAPDTGNMETLERYASEALKDRWHQPARATLIPELTPALAMDDPDLLGVCLSGAGPSIVALASRGFDRITGRLEQIYRECGSGVTIRNVSAEPSGVAAPAFVSRGTR